jgi:hypothetical protein
MVDDAGFARQLPGWKSRVDFLSTLATVLDYYRGLNRNPDDVVNRQ